MCYNIFEGIFNIYKMEKGVSDMAKQKRSIKTVIITIMLFAVIGMIIFLTSYIKFSSRVEPNPPGTTGNTGGNINNEGLFCQDGDTVYFSNTLDNNYIYSMKADGTDQKLVLAISAKYLNSAGKYLYYNQIDTSTDLVYGFTGNVHGIYRLKKGTRDQTKGFDRTAAGQVMLIDDYVYYQHYDNNNGMTLYRCSTNNEDKGEVLKEIVNPCCVYNSDIYYPDQNNYFYLNVFDTDTLKSTPYLNERMYNPVFSNGYIYYINISNGYCLSRYSFDSHSTEDLTTDRVDCFNILGDVIFYQRNAEDTPALMRMRSDGSDSVMIAMGNYSNINMTTVYTYFHSYGDPMDMYRVSTTGNPRPEAFRPQIIPKKANKFTFKSD